MATKAKTPTTRRCIGSARFGIAAHEAPVAAFPVQPKSRDGLGPMCKAHWTEYTRALRLARQAAASGGGTAKSTKAAAKSRPAKAAPKGAAATKRERRQRPMANLPVEASDVPTSIKRFVAKKGGKMPPASGIEVVGRSDDGFEAIISPADAPEA